MRINTNLTAMNTYTQYTKNQNKISSAVAKLSSGYAINTAADNAAGLAISEKMRAQIRGLDKASANAQDAISLVQTAEGALDSSTQILQRMRELAVQSASDTNENDIDRAALQDEFTQLQSELDDIAKNTTFNKKNLLDGSLATETKNLGTTSLANSGMTVNLGNAATGDYNFSVSTKLESAAVTGVEPTSVELVTDGAATYFSGSNSVALGANVAASDLLNGNYTLSATYADPTNDQGDGQITVKATGDNNQKFEAKVSVADLEALKTGTTLTLSFNKDADDAFNITLGLNSTIPTASESNYDTLAQNISKLSVSVSGGVTARDAEYGVYANLTGAESVKLEAGMSSVTFGNGVKVNFDTLTASSVDTANDASLTATVTFTGNGTNGMAAAATAAFTNMQALDDATVVNGAGTVSITAADATTVTFTFTDNDTNTYTSTVNKADLGLSAANGGVSDTTTLTFTDADGNNEFSLDLAVTNTGTATNFLNTVATATTQAATVQDAGHNYTKIFGAGTDADLEVSTASNFSVEATKNAGLTFQVGANEGDSMVINIDKMDANYLGVSSTSVATRTAAAAAIETVDSAINQVSGQRATLGAVQNRLEYKIDNLSTSSTNLTSAESQIRNVDMAKEMTEFTNANILSQAATAMLAQANSLPQSVLSLIGK
ncbi:hypothetical protein IZU99_08730 [Oscillospiraceae bacterium CM]|nr:hypothetical protein IZU99_08730 [Oscillospiraceae bacterium CM]